MAARQVIQGRYAEATAGGLVFLYLIDWKVEMETGEYEISGHGDTFYYAVPIRTRWSMTARGYCAPGEAPRYLHNLWRVSGTPASIVVAGYDREKTAAGSTKIWEGTAQPVKGVFDCPMAPATQDVMLRGYGAPTTGLSP